MRAASAAVAAVAVAHWRWWGLAAAASALLLAGCASRAPAPISSDPGQAAHTAGHLSAHPPASDYERQLVERAARAQSQGHWSRAQLNWEVLSVLRPQDAQVAQRLRATRQRVATLIDERLAAATLAQRRGDTELAVQAYLGVLALDQGHEKAAEALRHIESERTRRSAHGRFVATSEAAVRHAFETEARSSAGAGSVGPAQASTLQVSKAAQASSRLREHATLLAQQGEIDAAIELLRRSPNLRRDTPSRRLLADLYVQKAQALREQQPGLALKAVKAALALDRRHGGALALQTQLGTRPGNVRPPNAAAAATATTAATAAAAAASNATR